MVPVAVVPLSFDFTQDPVADCVEAPRKEGRSRPTKPPELTARLVVSIGAKAIAHTRAQPCRLSSVHDAERTPPKRRAGLVPSHTNQAPRPKKARPTRITGTPRTLNPILSARLSCSRGCSVAIVDRSLAAETKATKAANSHFHPAPDWYVWGKYGGRGRGCDPCSYPRTTLYKPTAVSTAPANCALLR
jgi:hypothetical protein